MDWCNTTTRVSNVTDRAKATGATILFPVLMSVAGVLGNILALYTLYKTRIDIRTTKFYNLITGLVCTDLLGILMTTPSVMLAYINSTWVGGCAHCRFHGFAMTCFALATPLIISTMAIERFLELKCFYLYSTKCYTGTARGCVFVIWLAVILYSLFPLVGFGDFQIQYPETWCFFDFHSGRLDVNIYSGVYSAVNILLITIMVLCNTYVVVTLFEKRIRNKHDHRQVSIGNFKMQRENPEIAARKLNTNRQRSAEIQMIVLLCAITTVFTVCWAPLTIRIFITVVTGESNPILDLLAVRFASLNQTLDPWLYIILRKSLLMKIGRGLRNMKKNTLQIISWRNHDYDVITKSRKARAEIIHGLDVDKYGPVRNGNNCQEQFSLPNAAPDWQKYQKFVPTMPVFAQIENNRQSVYICQLLFKNTGFDSGENGLCLKTMYYPEHANTHTRNSSYHINEHSIACVSAHQGLSKCSWRSLRKKSMKRLQNGIFQSDGSATAKKDVLHDELRETQSTP